MPKAAMGTKLKKGATVIAELTSISGLELSADTIETTTLSSPDGYRTFTQGLKDAGEVGISGYFDVSHEGLLNDFNSGAEIDYSIEFPAALGATWEFKAIVTAYSTGAEMEDNVSFESTLKVSGKPNLSITEA
ncbi:phage tail tube protein [Bacillus sp. SCS-151]|uniref:phage tail tube protein n=1 Tax=Nanhaiella sioensis TaxID=3115293 RepID=UPI003978EA46